jgi:hypothetical protein
VRNWGPPVPLYHIKPDKELDDIKCKVEVYRRAAIKVINEASKKSQLEYFQRYLGFTSNNIEGNTVNQEEVNNLLDTGGH